MHQRVGIVIHIKVRCPDWANAVFILCDNVLDSARYHLLLHTVFKTFEESNIKSIPILHTAHFGGQLYLK